MSIEYIAKSSNMQFQADGYDLVINTGTIRKLVVQVTGDDTQTWKLQGTLDSVRWYDLENESGASVTQINAVPQAFTVDKYSKCRITTSNIAIASVAHIKGISN